MLGAPGVDDGNALVEVLDQHRCRLAGERLLDPGVVMGGGHPVHQRDVDRVEQRRTRRHQQAGRELVVLGLGDQVGGQVVGCRAVVGQDRDLGRTGLGIDADDSAQQSLGRRDVDVAGSGHQVDPRHPLDPVGEHRDRLRPADRVDLVDPQQRARRQHGRVRPAAELRLRRRGRPRSSPTPATCAGTTFMTTLDGIGDQPAGHVQPDPADRRPALGDRGAGRNVDPDVGRTLRLVHLAGSLDRRRQGGS